MPNSKDFNRFAVNPTNIDISRSLFNMDHSVKFSYNLGDCVPFEVIPVMPGDTFSIDTTKVIRTQPLVAPVMQEIIQDTYWFFVPNRLVWKHWINFMGENDSSPWAPQVEYTIPQINIPSGGFAVGTIADYMGICPTRGVNYTDSMSVSALPFRAYALIIDQWFRSEALQSPVHVHIDDTTRTGSNGSTYTTDLELGGKPFIACKYFDYLTSCLPSPQRGDPVRIPLIDLAEGEREYIPVVSITQANHPLSAGSDLYTTESPYYTGVGLSFSNSYGINPASEAYSFNEPFALYTRSSNANRLMNLGSSVSEDKTNHLFFNNLWAEFNSDNVANLRSISINDLRTAFAIQKYMEKSARYGGRYQEFIKAFFNVDSPDARLQRAEYLGGSRFSLNINSVEQTSSTDSEPTPLGNVAGMSVTADQNSDFTKSFTEDGYIIGITCARINHVYQNSIDRHWMRKTKYEFYNPVFANLGEMPVYAYEINLLNGVGSSPSSVNHNFDVFGYQEAWADYRYLKNRVAGQMRSVASTPLDFWHMADSYNATTRTMLSASWIEEDKSLLDRCLAVTSSNADQMIADFYIEVEASRPMPLYSIPGLIDHH